MIEAAVYEKHKNLKLAANELGMKWQTLYSRLKKAGIPVVGDKSRYGTDSDRLAASAEKHFQEIVPYAINQNTVKFQSKIDFMVGSLSVDVKSSRKTEHNNRWAFCIKKQEAIADFFVCIAYENNEPTYYFLVPREIMAHYTTISVSPNKGGKWWQWEIGRDDLKEFFDSYVAS